MKHKQPAVRMFGNLTHNQLIEGVNLTGFTVESLAMFLGEHLTILNSSFFVQVDNEDISFSLYSSCIEHREDLFMFFPEIKGRGFVDGFSSNKTRFRKEAIIKLSSRNLFCCVGSKRSLHEKSIKKDLKDSLETVFFSVGDSVDIGVVSEKLYEFEYKKVQAANEPGSYSLKGDVLDIFPYHFKNPFRVSFEFDEIESISVYDPETQLSIKSIKELKLREFKVGTQVADNINVIDLFGDNIVYKISCFNGVYSISKGASVNDLDLGIKLIKLSGKGPSEKVLSAVKHSVGFKNKFLISSPVDKKKLKFRKGFLSGVFTGSINKSFVSDGLSSVFISKNEICSKKSRADKWSPVNNNRRSALDRNSISNIKYGEFIVHRDFGIGIYLGISRKNNKEVVVIEYQDSALVYVSLDQIRLIHKYIGSGKPPKISRLGSKRWKTEVTRAKRAVEDVVLDVVRGYSNRDSLRPFKYLQENDLDNVLSQSFSFIETVDQKSAINKVFSDMNNSRPMDRLICGDVGFGKTEVAIRGIFKAFLSDKLSVFLCPTTILADQHYMTCFERLSPFGVSIGLLSRFKTKAQQTKIIKDLSNNKIDVLVGTHRLLSKDVSLPNLGLLVVDEEHRFGVKDKDLIKSIKGGVDVLTLTATPIPRTLQQSLVGFKDVSLILTPPETRKPIITFVKYFDWQLVFSRIEFELSRSGQVYFLDNNISKIPSTVDRINKRFPNSRVAGASGKMNSRELENIVLAFFHGEIDILVCTTIIESGLDVTNANSIIIRDAQNLGLAQLYQIRGRVGRGERQAYCHLLIPNKPLEKSAFRRLKSLEKNTALGSGYNISMEDLEIRGAGSIFGHKQSGQISTVGFQLYCDLLSLEIQKAKSINGVVESAPQITTYFQTDISVNYIESMSLRIDYYYRIGSATSPNQIKQVKKDLIDVFGPIPKETERLISLALLKILYKKTPVSQIEIQRDKIRVFIQKLDENEQLEFLSYAVTYKNKSLDRLKFKENPDGHLCVILVPSLDGSVIRLLLDFLRLFDSFLKT